MHTDSEMTGISRSGSMHYMTAASLEMSDEPEKSPPCGGGDGGGALIFLF